MVNIRAGGRWVWPGCYAPTDGKRAVSKTKCIRKEINGIQIVKQLLAVCSYRGTVYLFFVVTWDRAADNGGKRRWHEKRGIVALVIALDETKLATSVSEGDESHSKKYFLRGRQKGLGIGKKVTVLRYGGSLAHAVYFRDGIYYFLGIAYCFFHGHRD